MTGGAAKISKSANIRAAAEGILRADSADYDYNYDYDYGDFLDDDADHSFVSGDMKNPLDSVLSVDVGDAEEEAEKADVAKAEETTPGDPPLCAIDDEEDSDSDADDDEASNEEGSPGSICSMEKEDGRIHSKASANRHTLGVTHSFEQRKASKPLVSWFVC